MGLPKNAHVSRWKGDGSISDSSPFYFCRAALAGSASRIAEARAPRLPKGCGPKHEDGGACLKVRPRSWA
jgi:hypothetical protein